jgi:hypothetical protein
MTFQMNRREAILGLGATLGTVALNALLQQEGIGQEKGTFKNTSNDISPLAPKASHHQAKAKRCIFIYFAGGPSHIDTFDPKPALTGLHLKEFQRKDKFASAMASGKRYYIGSPYKFRKVGKAGLSLCEEYQHLASVADELCIYRGCQAESINHPTANYHMNTGSRFGGDPAVGAWVGYGLGTENQNLPSFMVLPELNYPQGGAANWSNGFLPAYYQGTPLRAKGSPILDLQPPGGVTEEMQRANLDLLAKLNQGHAEQHPQHAELTARTAAYELAFRMQKDVPDILDLSKETQATLSAFGRENPTTSEMARRCLLARRLLEAGTRFVQIYVGGWDSHDYLERSHRARIAAVDQPIAALLKDLKERGMLEETLVVCCGEFGRSPDNGVRGGGKRVGRDHNAKAMAIWLAGGGVKAGHYVGATDEIGGEAVEVVHRIKDFHVTLLHLLGLDDSKLTYFHGGRYKQLSQVGGEVIGEILA